MLPPTSRIKKNATLGQWKTTLFLVFSVTVQ